jgi:hypothetical protein
MSENRERRRNGQMQKKKPVNFFLNNFKHGKCYWPPTKNKTPPLSSQRLTLEQIAWRLFITSKERVGSSDYGDMAIRLAELVHVIPPDQLEMAQYYCLSAAAVLCNNSTHPHYGTQCPPCNLLYFATIPHIHTTAHGPAGTKCPPSFNNIKMDGKWTACIHLVQDTDKWWTLAEMTIDLRAQ